MISYALYLIICILCPFRQPNQYPHKVMPAANFPTLYNWFTPKLNRHKMLYNLAHVIVADIRSNVLRRVIMQNNTSTNGPFSITRFITNFVEKIDSYRRTIQSIYLHQTENKMAYLSQDIIFMIYKWPFMATLSIQSYVSRYSPTASAWLVDGMYESLIGLCLLKSFVRVAIYKAQHNIQRFAGYRKRARSNYLQMMILPR